MNVVPMSVRIPLDFSPWALMTKFSSTWIHSNFGESPSLWFWATFLGRDNLVMLGVHLMCFSLALDNGNAHWCPCTTDASPNTEIYLWSDHSYHTHMWYLSQALLQSHSYQDSMILAQRQKYRSMEQNRKPRNKSTHVWTPYLWQRRQEFTMD